MHGSASPAWRAPRLRSGSFRAALRRRPHRHRPPGSHKATTLSARATTPTPDAPPPAALCPRHQHQHRRLRRRQPRTTTATTTSPRTRPAPRRPKPTECTRPDWSVRRRLTTRRLGGATKEPDANRDQPRPQGRRDRPRRRQGRGQARARRSGPAPAPAAQAPAPSRIPSVGPACGPAPLRPASGLVDPPRRRAYPPRGACQRPRHPLRHAVAETAAAERSIRTPSSASTHAQRSRSSPTTSPPSRRRSIGPLGSSPGRFSA